MYVSVLHMFRHVLCERVYKHVCCAWLCVYAYIYIPATMYAHAPERAERAHVPTTAYMQKFASTLHKLYFVNVYVSACVMRYTLLSVCARVV
jgi:hypothetical protein